MPETDTATTETTGDVSDDQAESLLADAVNQSTTTDTTDWKARYERLQADSRKWEDRAKSNLAAVKELEQLKKSRMTEQEKAVAEAEARGRSAATAATAGRLARAEFRAAAAGVVDRDALDGFLEYADLSKFVGEDGEPDSKAIEAAVKKLAGPQRTDFDGGARTTAGRPTDMSALIRQKAFGR